MKKLLIGILINIVLLGLVYASYITVNKTVDKVPENAISDSDTSSDGVYYSSVDVTVLIEKGMSEDLFSEVQQALSYFPAEIVTAFSESGWKIMIVSQIDFSNSEYEGTDLKNPQWTIGFTNYKTKIIQIKDLEVKNFVKLKLLHEMGHFVDLYFDNASYKDDFTRLYEKYKDSYVECEYESVTVNEKNKTDIAYATSINYEFFACALKDFLYHPQYLSRKYPDIYAYFEKLINGQN